MLKQEAINLFNQYIDSWKNNNLQLINECLTKNCIIIESHGPTYNGLDAIKQWLKLWNEQNCAVIKWDIKSFTFCKKDQIAFVEWDFVAICNHNKYILQGISVVKFVNHKIFFIHEYRMTKPEYDWKGNELNLE